MSRLLILFALIPTSLYAEPPEKDVWSVYEYPELIPVFRYPVSTPNGILKDQKKLDDRYFRSLIKKSIFIKSQPDS
ncbi:hypothetical protein V202x_15090 [Gimesia aquarii]|uniref:Uncharacterized protein n=1 Tax=Gimesia aquarii TaxID=2527964 RepID=A0A517WSA9_9PLAN|nr:hypothetical protein V202x_15090 [Gimesia aquarii]